MLNTLLIAHGFRPERYGSVCAYVRRAQDGTAELITRAADDGVGMDEYPSSTDDVAVYSVTEDGQSVDDWSTWQPENVVSMAEAQAALTDSRTEYVTLALRLANGYGR